MVAHAQFSGHLPTFSLANAPYRPPHGLPLYWRDEKSGVLAAAVTAYFGFVLQERSEPSAEQMALLWDYVNHHINAPCWATSCAGSFDEELLALRNLAAARGGVPELQEYLRQAMDIAIDPF